MDLHNRKEGWEMKLSISAGLGDEDAGNSLSDKDSANKISRDLQPYS